jgi:CheY-like chemotaxis protein
VLVLYSDERLLPANVIFDHSFRTNLKAGTSRHVEFHSEFLDVSRFWREVQQENQRDFLREKYRDYPPDIIVAVSASAVAFLMKYRASLFTEVPVVYLTWQGEPPPDLGDPKAAGISIPGSVDATLRLALDLQQDTRRIALVTGSSQRDKTLAEEARRGSGAFENRVALTWLTDLSGSLRQLCARPAATQMACEGHKGLEPLVFVVDDDQSVRMSLTDLLAREDYAVEIFASAAEYLTRVPHPGPACIVLEAHLPGFDGLALQRRLTEEARMEQIKGAKSSSPRHAINNSAMLTNYFRQKRHQDRICRPSAFSPLLI